MRNIAIWPGLATQLWNDGISPKWNDSLFCIRRKIYDVMRNTIFIEPTDWRNMSHMLCAASSEYQNVKKCKFGSQGLLCCFHKQSSFQACLWTFLDMAKVSSRSREYQINGSLRWLHVRWASPSSNLNCFFASFCRNTSRNATEWMSPVWWLVFNGFVVSYSGKTWASDEFSKTVIFASLVKTLTFL